MISIIVLVMSGLLIISDQLIKLWAMDTLQTGFDVNIIKDVLVLHYTENRGAAFGSFEGQKWILIGFTSILIISAIVYLLSTKRRSPYFLFPIGLIIAGGIGNLIDRIFKGYVVDYVYFKPIDFPVFNLADSCVVVGVILISIYIMFFYDKDYKKTKLINNNTGGIEKESENNGEI